MAKPGTKPTPTALKQLRGNPGGRPLNKREPKTTKRKAQKPRGLNKFNPLVARRWDQLAPILDEMGILTAADLVAFKFMLQHVQLAEEAAAELRQADGTHQLIRTDEQGIDRKHPLLQVHRDQSQMALRYLTEFGLTPSSRSRLQVEPDAQQLSLADVLFSAIDND